jgi:hypothetical protein
VPLYCYRLEDGRIVLRNCPVGKAPKVINHNGFKGERDIVAEHQNHMDTPGNWPMHSDALGVNPDQIPEAVKQLAEAGVHAEFNAEGQMKIESRQHRNRVLEASGMFDRDAGYGDRAPKDRPQPKDDDYA